MIFNTRRLEVHYLKQDQLTAFHDLQSNPNVMRFTGQGVLDFQENTLDLKKVIGHYSEENNGFWIWGIFLKGEHELIGTCAIVTHSDEENEIGYRFREKYWGNAYGIEITRGLIGHAFQTMKLNSLFADVDELNVHSVHILEDCMNFKSTSWNNKDKSNDRKYTLKNEKKSN